LLQAGCIACCLVFAKMRTRRIQAQRRVPLSLTLSPFDIGKEERKQSTSFSDDIVSAVRFQSFHLTDFAGASLTVDVQDGGSHCPAFHCRIRIDSFQKDLFAEAVENVGVKAGVSKFFKDKVNNMTVAQMRQHLQELGKMEAMKGKTRKEDVQVVLLALEEQRMEAMPARVVARAGEKGKVVGTHTNANGENRSSVTFSTGHMHVLPHQVKVGVPVPSDGAMPIGPGSKYQIVGGSITFKRKDGRGEEEEYFLSSPPTLAVPGVLVPWCKAFSVNGVNGQRHVSLFESQEDTECQVLAKLQVAATITVGDQDWGIDELSTPEPKAKRQRFQLEE